MSAAVGDAFKRRRSFDLCGHVWVVASHPTTDQRVVCVALTTFKGRPLEDTTCVLEKGDHPFVKHRTVVAYWDAELLDVHDIDARLQFGSWTREQRCSAAVVKRICKGFASIHAPPEAKAVMRAQGFIE